MRTIKQSELKPLPGDRKRSSIGVTQLALVIGEQPPGIDSGGTELSVEYGSLEGQTVDGFKMKSRFEKNILGKKISSSSSSLGQGRAR